MSKYVHGRVRLATASPRINLYDYGTKSYTPPDYYGDHFMYRDDPNLLPVRQGLYASYSPTPSQNQLTAYPPQTLYSNHSSSYSQGWNPTMSGCSCANMGYLGEGEGEGEVDQEMLDLTASPSPPPSDEEILAMIESGDIKTKEEDAGFLESIGKFFVDLWNALKGWWDGLSPEEQEEYRKKAKDVIDNKSGSGRIRSPAYKASRGAIELTTSRLSNAELQRRWNLISTNTMPYKAPSATASGGQMLREWRIQRSVYMLEMARRGLLPKVVSKFGKGNGQGNGQNDNKGGAGGLILGAGALFLLVKALL